MKIKSLFTGRHVAEDWVYKTPVSVSRMRDGIAVLGGYDHEPLIIRNVPLRGRLPKGAILIETQERCRRVWAPPRSSEPAEEAAAAFLEGKRLPPGTYELCGPGIRGNPEKLPTLMLFAHGREVVRPPALDRNTLSIFLKRNPMKGLVVTASGRPSQKVKVLRSELGLPWPSFRVAR